MPDKEGNYRPISLTDRICSRRAICIATMLLVISGTLFRRPDTGFKVFQSLHFMMDTYLRVVVYADEKDADQVQKEIDMAMAWAQGMEKELCTNSGNQAQGPEGLMNFLNTYRRAETRNRDIISLLEQSLLMMKATDNRLSIFLGHIIDEWNEAVSVPEFDRIKYLVNQAQNTILHISPQETGIESDSKQHFKLQLHGDGHIALGAIAKGWIVDGIVNRLVAAGYKHCLVDAGGDIRVGGAKPGNRPWRIALRNPDNRHLAGVAVNSSGDSKKLEIWEIFEGAVATSGVYERYTVLDGREYHHIFDPYTGFPTDAVISATVHAETAWQADALATAIVAGADPKDLGDHLYRVHVVYNDE